MQISKRFKCFLITTAVLFGIIAGLGIASWIEQKLDTRTPEQKERDAQKALLKDYKEIRRDFPSMKLDGKVVPVDLQWTAEGVTVILPKTYGFGATRFAQQAAHISRWDFRTRAKEYEGHYFLNVGVKIWSGPSESWISYRIAIPKKVVPDDFEIRQGMDQ